MTTVRQLRKRASQASAKSRAKALDNGARRVDLTLRDPVAVAGLAALEREYGTTTAAITAALREYAPASVITSALD